jgi:hypothetical protein
MLLYTYTSYTIAYALSSVDERGVPRVRHVIHRSFLKPESRRPLLVTTTDVRARKVAQLTRHGGGVVERGGGVVELAWWIAEAGEQYRIEANAHVLPHPTSAEHAALHAQFPFERLAPPVPVSVGNDPDDSSSQQQQEHHHQQNQEEQKQKRQEEELIARWEKERRGVFDDKMGGTLRASFVRPTPGTVLIGGYDEAKEWPARVPRSAEAVSPEEEEAVRTALENFALVVLEPVCVERVELAVVSDIIFLIETTFTHFVSRCRTDVRAGRGMEESGRRGS